MTTTLEWEGHKIELRIFFTPRLVMVATDATVTVDGRRVARKGGLGLSETAVGSSNHNGREIRTEAGRSAAGWASSRGYRMRSPPRWVAGQ